MVCSGERVAYSALGSVTSLSGDPEPGVVVEAVGQGSQQCSQLQEESSTETSGQFRIRGLNPQVGKVHQQVTQLTVDNYQNTKQKILDLLVRDSFVEFSSGIMTTTKGKHFLKHYLK